MRLAKKARISRSFLREMVMVDRLHETKYDFGLKRDVFFIFSLDALEISGHVIKINCCHLFTSIFVA